MRKPEIKNYMKRNSNDGHFLEGEGPKDSLCSPEGHSGPPQEHKEE